MMAVVMVPALVAVGALPSARSVHIAEGEGTPERADNEAKRPVVVTSDSGTLVVRERETTRVENVKGTRPMPTSVALARLAEVVEEGHDGNALGGKTAAYVRTHMFIYFDRVLRKSTALLVVPVTATREIVR